MRFPAGKGRGGEGEGKERVGMHVCVCVCVCVRVYVCPLMLTFIETDRSNKRMISLLDTESASNSG